MVRLLDELIHDKLLQSYLSTVYPKDYGDNHIKTHRFKEHHLSILRIPYGSKENVVFYGERVSRNFKEDDIPKINRKQTENGLMEKALHKLDGLLREVSSPDQNLDYATEILHDLIKLRISPFPSSSFYDNFLADMGSVIKQGLPVQVSLIYHKSKYVSYPMAVGYNIERYNENEDSNTAQSPSVGLMEKDNNNLKPDYFNRPGITSGTRTPKHLRLNPNSEEVLLSPTRPPKIFKMPLTAKPFKSKRQKKI